MGYDFSLLPVPSMGIDGCYIGFLSASDGNVYVEGVGWVLKWSDTLRQHPGIQGDEPILA